MKDKIKISDLPEFDLSEHLKSEGEVATYLTIVIEEGDSAERAHALGVAAKSRGMTEFAKAAGIHQDA